jgi:hypothetical protein
MAGFYIFCNIAGEVVIVGFLQTDYILPQIFRIFIILKAVVQ